MKPKPFTVPYRCEPHDESGRIHEPPPYTKQDWIVPKGWNPSPEDCVWVGSDYRSLTEPREGPFIRNFSDYRRFSDIHIAWQDPDYPETIHAIGTFQVDRQIVEPSDDDESGEKHNAYSIRFRSRYRFIEASIRSSNWTRIGRTDRSHGKNAFNPRNSHILAPYLGKNRGEILVRFLHEDQQSLRNRRLLKSIHGLDPQPPGPCSNRRDFILSHAWDNYESIENWYSRHRGRIGMYDLPD